MKTDTRAELEQCVTESAASRLDSERARNALLESAIDRVAALAAHVPGPSLNAIAVAVLMDLVRVQRFDVALARGRDLEVFSMKVLAATAPTGAP